MAGSSGPASSERVPPVTSCSKSRPFVRENERKAARIMDGLDKPTAHHPRQNPGRFTHLSCVDLPPELRSQAPVAFPCCRFYHLLSGAKWPPKKGGKTGCKNTPPGVAYGDPLRGCSCLARWCGRSIEVSMLRAAAAAPKGRTTLWCGLLAVSDGHCPTRRPAGCRSGCFHALAMMSLNLWQGGTWRNHAPQPASSRQPPTCDRYARGRIHRKPHLSRQFPRHPDRPSSWAHSGGAWCPALCARPPTRTHVVRRRQAIPTACP